MIRITIEDQQKIMLQLQNVGCKIGCTLENQLWILLACQAGLREMEIASLKYQDIYDDNDSDNKNVIKRNFIHHKGKMKTKMRVFLNDEIINLLKEKIKCKPKNGVYLFTSRKNRQKHIGAKAIYKFFVRFQIKLFGQQKYSFHDLRRMAITRFYEKTRDLEKTRIFARHKFSETTRLYIMLDKNDKEYNAFRKAA